MSNHHALALGAAVGALLLAGCARSDSDGEGAPGVAASSEPSPRSPGESSSTAAVEVTADEVPDVAVGHLEHPARLASFFARLSALDDHKPSADVRVVQLGDSHTASDYGTAVARARLALRFGDGGRGFVPLGVPYRRLFQGGEAMARASGFEAVEVPAPGSGSRTDGLSGPSGVAMDGHKAGAFLLSELTASADRYEIGYLAQPGGGAFDVYVDGQLRAHVATEHASQASAFHALDVARGPHTLEIRAVGDGAVRVFGVRLEDQAPGVTFDSFGMNGAKATTLLASDEAHFAEQMAHTSPSLAILAYGTNESGDSTTTPEEHAAAIRSLVARITQGAPGVECLVLGPLDRGIRTFAGVRTLPKVRDIAQAQRRAADDAGCAFYDQLAAMGGEGAIGRWANESPPRARRDLVHLTRAGYAFVAEALVADLVLAYETWKSDRASAAPAR